MRCPLPLCAASLQALKLVVAPLLISGRKVHSHPARVQKALSEWQTQDLKCTKCAKLRVLSYPSCWALRSWFLGLLLVQAQACLQRSGLLLGKLRCAFDDFPVCCQRKEAGGNDTWCVFFGCVSKSVLVFGTHFVLFATLSLLPAG